MTEQEIYDGVIMSGTTDFAQVIESLRRHGAEFCVIGGMAVNSYVTPVYTADLDLVVMTADLALVLDDLRAADWRIPGNRARPAMRACRSSSAASASRQTQCTCTPSARSQRASAVRDNDPGNVRSADIDCGGPAPRRASSTTQSNLGRSSVTVCQRIAEFTWS